MCESTGSVRWPYRQRPGDRRARHGDPAGVPLVFGEAYAEAASMAVIWVFGLLFLEAAARMVWRGAVANSAYRWLMTSTWLLGALTLAIMATLASAELSNWSIALSLLRIGFVGAILLGAAQRGYSRRPAYRCGSSS